MRVIACWLLALSVSLGPGARAASNLQAGAQQQLARLEKRYFGHSFDADPEERRAERLEKLIFGEPSSGDAGQRVRSLVSATAGTALPESGGQPEPPAPAPARTPAAAPDVTDNAAQPEDPAAETACREETQPDADQSDYPRITALEQAILGQRFPGQPLGERISRMESKAFGSPSTIADMSARTEALERYAQKKLHKNVRPPEPEEGAAQPGRHLGPQLPKQLLSMVGNSLLGVGTGMIGLGNVGYGGVGVGNPGPGQPGSVGFGAPAPGAYRSAAQRQVEAMRIHQEDPIVNSPTPPPPGAKLVTRIGWCEVQVFGHTFPELHLPQRLGQLRRQLNFEPGLSDFDLMDHVGDLVKAVQAQRPQQPPDSVP